MKIRIAFILGALAFYSALIFSRSTNIGLSADDLMNTWIHSMPRSWSAELANIVTFSIPLDRSTGALVYRSVYVLFGLQPLALHGVLALLLAANALVWFLALERNAPWQSALVCVSLLSWWPQMQDIYLSSGTIYDTLASLTMWAAYVLLKQSPRPRWMPVFLALLSYQLALGAKEVALCLPVLLFADWLFLNRNRASLLCFAVVLPQTLWYVFRKFLGPNAMTANGGYSLEVTGARAAENLIWYTRWATDFLINEPSIPLIALLAATPLMIAAILRDKRPLVGWILLLTFTALLLFPLHRNLYVFFAAMPAFGFCVLPVVDRLVRLHKHAWLVLAALSLATLFAWDRNSGAKYRPALEAMSQPVIQVLASPALASLQVPRSGLVLVQDDPFPFDDYALQMLLSLKFKDPALAVVRLKFHPMPLGQTPDAVVNFGKAPPPAN